MVADFSGNDNHGTLSGSGSLVPGKFSHSLALQPSESLSADGGRLSLSSEVSLSVWTKIRDDDYGIIAQGGQVRLEYHDDNTIRASVRIGNTWSELRARSVLGKWVHYALTYDGTSLRLFVNGVKSDELALTGSLHVEQRCFAFGG